MSTLDLVVSHIAAETAQIRRVVLERADRSALPGFRAGSHVTLHVPGVGVRKYSLINADTKRDATLAPTSYTLGVRLDPASAGGSRYVHSLKLGDQVRAEAPQNDFPVRAHAGTAVLVGGGIGITPLISMAAELKGAGRPFRVIYAGRSQGDIAFQSELSALAGDQLAIHTDDTAGRFFDVAGLFASLGADDQVYMCGPKPMLKAGIDAGRALGWPRDRVAFELFYSAAPAVPKPVEPPPAPVGANFEVVVKSTGQSFSVPADKTILDVLIEAGLDPMHDCKKGECGVCQVGVLEGVPDHKDVILSESERATNKTMQICISRSKTPRLVLDL